jgi:hypothetical protein
VNEVNSEMFMEPIRVVAYPGGRKFPSFTTAIKHAISDARLPAIRDDAARLQGSAFDDALWTMSEWRIQFDCAQNLRIWVDGMKIRWRIYPATVESAGETFSRVGAPAVMFNWVKTIGLREMDCSSLVAKRRGARFKDIFINDSGLFVYLDGCPILEFGLAQVIDDGRAILEVSEDV